MDSTPRIAGGPRFRGEEREMPELLPSELWTEILVRLPVITLLTLKCVSKSFLSLIQNPNFAYLHLSRFNNCYSESNDYDLFLLDRVSDSELGVCRGNTESKYLEFKISIDKSDRVVGYVNGLFWLHRFHNPWAYVIVCNPSIRKWFFVPANPVFNSGFNNVGFGYDPLSDDYKVVVIVFAICDPFEPSRARPKPRTLVEVYSFKMGSWRSIEAHDILHNWFYGMGKNIYANGAIHWMASNKGRYYSDNHPNYNHLVSFDLGTEVFSFKELPEDNVVEYEGDPFERVVKLPVLFRGSLAVVYISRLQVCVWVMTENGWNEECMIESHHELYQCLFEDCRGFCNNAIFCEKTDELLITSDEEGLVSYNLKTQQYKTSYKGVRRVGTYVENLLWRELLPPNALHPMD